MNALSEKILHYLYLAAQEGRNQGDPFHYVPSHQIRQYLSSAAVMDAWSDSEYQQAIYDLVQREYLEQRSEYYQITAKGEDYIYLQMHPELDPNRAALEETKKSTRINQIGLYITIIMLIIAIFGTPASLFKSLSPGASRSTFFNKTITKQILIDQAVSIDGKKVNSNLLQNWFDQVPDSSNNSKMPVPLSNNSPVIEIDSVNSGNSYFILIPVNTIGSVRLHLLMNLCYGSPDSVGGQEFARSNVARLWLFSGDMRHSFDLKAGIDLREWVITAPNVVNTVGSHVKLIWKSHYKSSNYEAVIDDLVLQIPYDWREVNLEYIGIEDRSRELFGNPNPGIMLFGIAVDYLE